MNTFLKKASATVITIFSFALPFTASAYEDTSSSLRTEDWSTSQVIRTFMNTGGSASASFDNDSIDSTGFDFAAIISHPCYEPVGEYVADACDRRFGGYGNLKNALRTTHLRTALVAKFGPGILSLLQTANADIAADEAEDAAQAEEDSDVVNFYGDFRARRIQLWDICQERFGSSAAACYQDNLRLLGESEIAIRGNVNHRTTVTQ